jgi:predicted kinase
MGHSRQRERRQAQLVAESLARRRSVVVDNTNPSVSVRAPLIALAKAHGAEVVGYFFTGEAADALRRNRTRQGRERVPDVAVFATRKRLEAPTFAEGFDRLFSVRLDDAQHRFDVVPMEKAF